METRSLKTTWNAVDAKTFVGRAAVYNSPAHLSQHGQPYTERIRPGAIVARENVWCLYGHDENKPMGCTEAKTLRLDHNNEGLDFTLDIPETSYGQDAKALLARGEPIACSIGFFILKDSWNNNRTERTLEKIDLVELSLTAFPAYRDTHVALRSKGKEDLQSLRRKKLQLLELEM